MFIRKAFDKNLKTVLNITYINKLYFFIKHIFINTILIENKSELL